MQNPRFMTRYQIMSPPPAHEGYIYRPEWTVPPQQPSNGIYGSQFPRFDARSSTIRRVHQRSLARQPLPWPTTRPVHRPRASYPVLTIKPIHLTRKPRDWRGSYKSPSKGGLGRYFRRIGLAIPSDSLSLMFSSPVLTCLYREPVHTHRPPYPPRNCVSDNTVNNPFIRPQDPPYLRL